MFLKKNNKLITIEYSRDQGVYSILTTQYRKGWGKKRDVYLTGLPNNAEFIE